VARLSLLNVPFVPGRMLATGIERVGMKTRRDVIAAGVAVFGWAVGLSSTALAQADPGRHVAAPEGTVSTYQRKSEGSYGKFEGAVTWTIGRREWNGRMLVSSSSPTHGAQLFDPQTAGLVVQFAPSGKPAYAFEPPVTHEWPLAAGKSWRSVHGMTTFSPPGTLSATFDVKVEAYEELTVPAGTFMAFKVVVTSSFGEVDQTWTVPAQGGLIVKRIADRPASHPLGAGHLEGVLVARTVPR